MRHSAWLSAPQADDKGQQLPSRLEALKEDGGVPERPPPPLCEYMVGYLWDAGPCMAGGMGNAPLSHSEIKAWQDNTGIELNAWEAQTLRALSSAYVAECINAKSPDCPAPWSSEITEIAREDVGKKVQNAFQTLMSTRPKK